MSSLEKLKSILRLPNGEEEEYEGEYDSENNEEANSADIGANDHLDDPDIEPSPKATRKALIKTSPRTNGPQKKAGSNSSMEVCVCKPTNFDDAKLITDALLAGRSVVLNLEGLEIALARRIFDFAMGSCYALNGRLEAISNYVMVITPESVYISGDTTADTSVLDRALTEG